MAVFRQSLQRPDFFILLRVSTARALARSCRSSGVRRTRFGVMFVLVVLAAGWLWATSARDLGDLFLWGWVLPALAGFREAEGELEGTTYCTRVRGNLNRSQGETRTWFR